MFPLSGNGDSPISTQFSPQLTRCGTLDLTDQMAIHVFKNYWISHSQCKIVELSFSTARPAPSPSHLLFNCLEFLFLTLTRNLHIESESLTLVSSLPCLLPIFFFAYYSLHFQMRFISASTFQFSQAINSLRVAKILLHLCLQSASYTTFYSPSCIF